MKRSLSLFAGLALAAGAQAQQAVVNELYRGGNLTTTDEWLEIVLTQSLTAAQLEALHVGDSQSATTSKLGAFRLQNMSTIATNFPAGTVIVFAGQTGPAEDTSYNPASGDWNLIFRTNNARVVTVTSGADFAGDDVAWVDNNATGATITPGVGFCLTWDGSPAPGAFGAACGLTIPFNTNNTGAVLSGSIAAATTVANWTPGVALGSMTPGQPNGGANTTSIQALRNLAPTIEWGGFDNIYIENDPDTIIDNLVSVSDDSADFNGGFLRISMTNASAADRLVVFNEGNGAGQIGVAGSTISYGGLAIGTIDGTQNGVGTQPLQINFNSASATPVAAQALARNLAFFNTSEDPSTTVRGLTLTLDDGDGGSDTSNNGFSLFVESVNDAPVVSASLASINTSSGAPPILVDASVTFNDVDTTDFDGGFVRIATTLGGNALDVYSVQNQGTGPGQIGVAGPVITFGGNPIGSIDGTQNGQAGVALRINLSGPVRVGREVRGVAGVSAAAVQALLRNLTFATTGPAGARTAAVTVDDGVLMPMYRPSTPRPDALSTPVVYTINVSGGDPAPTISSVTRLDPNPTTPPGTVRWSVVFSESVTGVDLADFAVANSGGHSGATLSGVIGSGSTYTVTATLGTGNGQVGLNVLDNDSILDGASQPLNGPGTGGVFNGPSYDVGADPAPFVAGIIRLDANPASTPGTVRWGVVFSESVTGFDLSDLQIVNNPNHTGATLTGITGSGANYTVTATLGSGNGEVGINVIDNDSIIDSLSQPLNGVGNGGVFFGIVYQVGDPPPFVASIQRSSPNPTTPPSSVCWNVFFNEPVVGVNLADFVLAPNNAAAGTLTGVTGSGALYSVCANVTAGPGDLGVNVVDDDTIVDLIGQPLNGPGSQGVVHLGAVYTVLNPPPFVLSIDRLDPNPANSPGSVRWAITFNESVTGVDTADFALVAGGAVSGASVTNLTGSGAAYTLTANLGVGAGTLGLNLVDNDSIIDSTSLPLGGSGVGNGNFTGQVYNVLDPVPVVVSVLRASPNPATSPGTVDWTVSFSEPVTGVNAADFALAVGGAITGASITNVAGSAASYTVTANLGVGNGTLGLNVVDDDTVRDAANQPLAGTGIGNGNFTGEVYGVNDALPTLVSLNRLDPNPATSPGTVRWAAVFSEAVTGVNAADFQLVQTGAVSGASISLISGSGTTYTISASTGTGSGTLGLNLVDDDSIRDAANQPLAGVGAGNGNFTGQVYTINDPAPTVLSINRLDPNPNAGPTLRWAVTFSESVTGVDLADFQLVVTGTVAGQSLTSITGSGASYTVTANFVNGVGSLGLNLVDDDSIRDSANQPLAGTGAGNGNFTGQVYNVNRQLAEIIPVGGGWAFWTMLSGILLIAGMALRSRH